MIPIREVIVLQGGSLPNFVPGLPELHKKGGGANDSL